MDDELVEARRALATLCVSARKHSSSVRQPSVLRSLLADAQAFAERREEWQLEVLAGVAAALRTRYDVMRFVCLREDQGEPVNPAEDHSRLLLAVLEVHDLLREPAPKVADAALEVLSRLLSAGVSAENAKMLLQRAAAGLLQRDSAVQLRFLNLLDKAVRAADRGSSGVRWEGAETDDALVYRALNGAWPEPAPSTEVASPRTPPEPAGQREARDASGSAKASGAPPPPQFFSFGGPGARMELTGIGKWPFKSEYCAWFWVRLEEGSARCNLLRLQTLGGLGINISVLGDDVIGYSLMLESRDERHSGATRVSIPPERMRSRRWHQISVHHYARMLGSSVVKVAVDGHEIKQGSGYGFTLVFPSRMGDRTLASAAVFEDFDGQAGPFYLFREGVGPPAAAGLLRAHARFFLDKDRMDAVKGSGLIAAAGQPPLDALVFLNLDPAIVVDRFSLDVYGSHHANIKGDAFVWTLPPVRDAVVAAGGVPALLPFLWKKTAEAGGVGVPKGPALVEGACILQIISLLGRLLHGHWVSQREFVRLSGPALIASALERIPSQVLALACSDALVPALFTASIEEGDVEADELAAAAATAVPTAPPGLDAPFLRAINTVLLGVAQWAAPADGGADARGGNELEEAMDRELLFNARLLARCSNGPGEGRPLSLAQIQWFDFLELRCASAVRAVAQPVATLQRWLDGMRDVYVNLVANMARAEAGGSGDDVAAAGSVIEAFSVRAVRVGVVLLGNSVSEADIRAILCAITASGQASDMRPSAAKPNVPAALAASLGLQADLASNSKTLSAAELLLARDALRLLVILLRKQPAPVGLFSQCARLDSGTGLAAVLASAAVGRADAGESVRALALLSMHEYLARVGTEVGNLESITKVRRTAVPSWGLGKGVPLGAALFARMGGYWRVKDALEAAAVGAAGSQQAQRLGGLNGTYVVLLRMMIADPQPERERSASSFRRRSSVSSATSTGSALAGVREDDWQDVFDDLSKSAAVLDDSQVVRNPHALMVILKLLPLMDLYLQQRVCQDLFLLLKFKPINRVALRQVPNWEGAFLGLLGSLDREGLRTSGAQVCFDLGVKVLLLVLQDALIQHPEGWKSVEMCLGLRRLVENGAQVMRDVLVQLLESIHHYMQSEDISDVIDSLWESLRRLTLLVDMACEAMAEGDGESGEDKNDKGSVEKIKKLLLRVVDLACSLPPHLLKPGAHGAPVPSSPGKRELLREFCWPVDSRKQGELDKIRGPVCFALLSLTLEGLVHAPLDAPGIGNHCRRLCGVLAFLRELPQMRSLIRWSTLRGNKIKGEKSALIARTYVTVHQMLGRVRDMGEKQHDPAIVQTVEHLGTVLDALRTHHIELLSMLAMDDAFVAKLKGLDLLAGPAWIGSTVMLEPVVGQAASHELVGFQGAVLALDEARAGLRAVARSRLDAIWKRVQEEEAPGSAPPDRSYEELESRVSSFQQRLAYTELNRLAACYVSERERECELVDLWRGLTLEAVHERSIWWHGSDAGPKQRWMMSDKEDCLRCRRLLCRNFDFTDHSDAVYREQKGEDTSSATLLQASPVPVSPIPPHVAHVRVPSIASATARLVKIEQVVDLVWFQWLGGRLVEPAAVDDDDDDDDTVAEDDAVADSGANDAVAVEPVPAEVAAAAGTELDDLQSPAAMPATAPAAPGPASRKTRSPDLLVDMEWFLWLGGTLRETAPASAAAVATNAVPEMAWFRWLGGKVGQDEAPSTHEVDLTWFTWAGGRTGSVSQQVRSADDAGEHLATEEEGKATIPVAMPEEAEPECEASALAEPSCPVEPESEAAQAEEDAEVVQQREPVLALPHVSKQETAAAAAAAAAAEEREEPTSKLEPTLIVSQTPDLTYFRWNGGRMQGEEVGASPVEQPKTPATAKTETLLSEVDDWAIGKSSGFRREHFALHEGEVLVHVCTNARWVTPLRVTKGRLEISTEHIFFYATQRGSGNSGNSDEEQWAAPDAQHGPSAARGPGNDMMRWSLAELTEIHGRRYLLRSTALELFFKDMTNTFLCFPSPKAREDCFKAILKQPTPSLAKMFKSSLSPSVVFERSGLVEKWRRREISNFEYLMQLNTMAGRSYNDITQYPVFPWVLCDYESTEIDLEDERVFRDLSKPMGALNEERLREFVERFETFSDPTMEIPAFHYGSHYSNAGIVLHYMLRVEPFTTLAIDLQGGRFDCPDRLFFSVRDCWLSSMESMSDVKELTPEFFFCPEMFRNDNDLPLGTPQGASKPIGDVELPPWAKGSADEFVRVNREALESEYVSRNLHHWIDLVFGHKQTGKAAEAAHNVFYYLTYEGAVDLDAIVDPMQRHAIETQIAHFGQTPSQLLTKPHPARQPPAPRQRLLERALSVPAGKAMPTAELEASFAEVWSEPANAGGTEPAPDPVRPLLGSLLRRPARQGQTGSEAAVSAPPLVALRCFEDRVVLMHEDLSVGVHRLNDGRVGTLGSMRVLNAWRLSLSARARPRDRALIGTQLGIDRMRLGSEALLVAKQGKLLLSGLYFDGSLRAQGLDNHRVEEAVVAHRGVVRCLALCEKGELVVSGADDGQICVWLLGGANDIREEMLDLFGAPDLRSRGDDCGVLNVVRHLSGHCAPVTAVAVSNGMSVVVSGGASGHVLVHSLQDGSLVRTLLPSPLGCAITALHIGAFTGNILLHARERGLLGLWTINGTQLSSTEDAVDLTALALAYANGAGAEVVLAGSTSGMLTVRRSHDLAHVRTLPLESRGAAICSLAMAPRGDALLVGTSKGQLASLRLSAISATLDV